MLKSFVLFFFFFFFFRNFYVFCKWSFVRSHMYAHVCILLYIFYAANASHLEFVFLFTMAKQTPINRGP